MEIKNSLNLFLKETRADERYASFDFCYNYFYSFYEEDKLKQLADAENLQMSCLQIGFYLASWGMMRGSSFLLQKSVRNFSKLILAISNMDKKLWEIDVTEYNDKNIGLLLNCKEEIKDALGEIYNPSDTLITKIMLGVFANVAAYDANFKNFLKKNGYCQTFNKNSLLRIQEFYQRNSEIFEKYIKKTLDFSTGNDTGISYTKAKLTDMHGFIDGQVPKISSVEFIKNNLTESSFDNGKLIINIFDIGFYDFNKILDLLNENSYFKSLNIQAGDLINKIDSKLDLEFLVYILMKNIFQNKNSEFKKKFKKILKLDSVQVI